MTQQELAKIRLQRMLDKFEKSNNANDTSVLNNTDGKKVAKYKGPYPLPSKLSSTGVDKFRSSLSR